ncbi:MAG TPA: pilus (MSHA type) biogenesis protein MshL [Burkholderiaceae bacterium]|nr:pilus (MSHA type) biogenesis protein MshL [Burkholderiaceae bacterium]
MKPDLDALLEDPPAIALVAPWTLVLLGVILALLLTGCATPPRSNENALMPEVRAALSEPAQPKPAPLPPAVANALVPPADLSLPALNGRTAEPRFDLNVVGLPAAQVFAALAKDTRYSMLVDPALTTPVTVNLKDVTLVEALETLREMYGFEYRVQGTRVFVQPATLTTRLFQVSYLTANRAGRSDVRVTSGSITNPGNTTSGAAQATNVPTPTTISQESSHIVTQSKSDLWAELEASLRLLVGVDGKSDRQVIVSPQSGVIVVRGLPKELRAVESYLRAARLNIERQVMLEAKIVDVQLSDGSQTGVNWAAFINGNNHRGSIGPINPGTTLTNNGALGSGDLTATPGSSLALASTAANGLFGLAFQTSNFAALLQFLETQGNVQVLSSPRIAAINNQKAVLKVGTDDFFVTGITTTTTASSTGNVTSPTITVQPFFSGVALDITPQIDENASIILHVHPSVSSVSEHNKVLNLGDLGGTIVLPLASSTVSETDTIVRVRDGAIVAIGGLMKASRAYNRDQLPGAGDIPVAGNLFASTTHATQKSELVILIKPTVINSDAQLDALRDETLDRLDALAARPDRM